MMGKKENTAVNNKPVPVDWQELLNRLKNMIENIEHHVEPSRDEIRVILKERAQVLAQVPPQAGAEKDFIEVLEFRLAQEVYGIETVFVREVYPLKDFTPLPGTPSFVLGIINVRGQILSVVDIKKFFHLREKGLGDLNKVIILHSEMMEFGILADMILGTRTVAADTIQDPPVTVTGIGAEYIKGITAENFIILDAERILGDENMIINDEVPMAG